MNEKAPEEAERGSALRISSPGKKVARKLGAERMWPSGGGTRTGNHKGWKVMAVAGAGSSTNRSSQGECGAFVSFRGAGPSSRSANMRKRDQSHPLARDDGAVNNDGHETGTKTSFIFGENPFLPGGP